MYALEKKHSAPQTQGLLQYHALMYAVTYICTFLKKIFNMLLGCF